MRRYIYSKWAEKLRRFGIEPLFLHLDPIDIPIGCPIRVRDASLLQREVQNKGGYYLKRHWPLSDEVELLAPTSLEISKSIITLPIYNGITEKVQDMILSDICEIIFIK
jgi:hypothetical protein